MNLRLSKYRLSLRWFMGILSKTMALIFLSVLLCTWSLFVQANNILSVAEKLHYQHWYGYETVGFTVLLGASLAF